MEDLGKGVALRDFVIKDKKEAKYGNCISWRSKENHKIDPYPSSSYPIKKCNVLKNTHFTKLTVEGIPKARVAVYQTRPYPWFVHNLIANLRK